MKETHKLPLQLQLAIFLDWVAHGSTYRKQRDHFRISHTLIHNSRVNIADAIISRIYNQYVTQPTSIPTISHPDFRFFQGAFGCIDGSHIPILAPMKNKDKWRCRKGYYSTNGLLIADTNNLLFQFALFGAEGCGSDSSVFKSAIKYIHWLQDGFLIGDAGYGLSTYLLTPYRGVRYHLKEFGLGSERPKNFKELFNLRHAIFRYLLNYLYIIQTNIRNISNEFIIFFVET